MDVTSFLRSYAAVRRFWNNSCKPGLSQSSTLQSLVRRAALTQFGRDHMFSSIANVAEFQNRVPLRNYEDYWIDYWQKDFPRLENQTWPGLNPFFAETSGTTTDITKYIPCSWDMLRSNRRAAVDLLVYHLARRPESRVMGGKLFMLGGTSALTELDSGIYSGDISGIAMRRVPWWVRSRCFPPTNLADLGDWDEKVPLIAEASRFEDIRLLGGTPSWLLLFIQALTDCQEDDCHLTSHYPNLELLVHGGVSFSPYRRRFEALLEGSHAELCEIYAASEGFFAVADRGDGEGLRLILDHGIFYEFVPVEELHSRNPTRHWVETIETDVDYAVVVSTCAGVWGYIIGDTVRFIDRDFPRLLVTGRISYTLSAFGEHLIAAEIDKAIVYAANSINAHVSDYSVGSIYPSASEVRGGHLYIVEFADSMVDNDRLSVFAERVDVALREMNRDYSVHRAGDFGLQMPSFQAVPPGTFAAWMKKRDKLGGQNKVPRVINEPSLFDDLQQFAQKMQHARLV